VWRSFSTSEFLGDDLGEDFSSVLLPEATPLFAYFSKFYFPRSVCVKNVAPNAGIVGAFFLKEQPLFSMSRTFSFLMEWEALIDVPSLYRGNALLGEPPLSRSSFLSRFDIIEGAFSLGIWVEPTVRQRPFTVLPFAPPRRTKV